ncbi:MULTISPECIES: CHASE2 domain-containing protein [Dictyoglomus]|uniref:Adenylate/guanylate cyclase with Chase sensor n=1 Tax=Dictyoglomus turgidum (strain DSM 6724 / Z-1310) TaxID=515635 RepID=B8E2Z7_DICTD|nr:MULTISPECIES: adenylate/guanylate cyclase domain-containing protein [Dictyoglomus]ACK42497.1 adenylate/guanylate cyclase with Chase sensor [Dictyoglomus turgidum DSM 6724]HBU32046.1 adenylate/guanylate cyclase domain-containing protein [Dictyoglomus sp.]
MQRIKFIIRDKKLYTRVLITISSIIFTIFIFKIHWLYNLELSSINLRFSLRGEKEITDPIVIIGIDDSSIEELGNFPWDRKIYKTLIEKLGEYPKVIAFDLYFDIKSNKDSDKVFSELLKTNNRIIIAAFYTITDNPKFGSIKRLFLPLDIFSRYSKVGLVNHEYDNDGFIRRFSLIENVFDNNWYSFPLLVSCEFLDITPEEYLKNVANILKKDNKILINYRGGPYLYPYFSFVDIINGNFDPIVFKDKIVLIGATTEALHDTYFVPFSGYVRKGSRVRLGKMPGVEIHANSIGTLLKKDFIHLLNSDVLTFFISFILSIFPLFLPVSFGNFLRFFILTLMIALYFIFTNITFLKHNILLPYYIPPIGASVSYLSNLIYDLTSEEKEKRRIRDLFQRFISPRIIDELLELNHKTVVYSRRSNISVIFADIRNFTYYSDLRKPEEIVEILNEFFALAIEVIFKYGGTVDKFMGDAIMAIFGAPIYYGDFVERAVYSSLEIQRRLKELQKNWELKGYPKFEVGIGIATGEALVGIVGPSQKIEYTAIGSTVNLASRLESIAKGGEILICENTYERIKDKFMIEDLGYVNIKGKERPVHIYKVTGILKDEEKA